MRVCLITSGQPSTNPRLVKEADTLVAEGYDVRVIGAQWSAWASQADHALLARRRWTCQLIDWRRDTNPLLYWRSGVRHRLATMGSRVGPLTAWCAEAAASRVGPELTRAALEVEADLYVAHNLGALPAAAAAATLHGARLGFDAEDYHRGQPPASDRAAVRAIAAIEGRYLPRCDYVTAASPGIAAAYAGLCNRPPVVILNVFPLADRAATRPAPRPSGPVRLYWFSQTVGRGRGLEDVIVAMGQLPAGTVELHLRGQWQPGFETELRRLASQSGVDWSRIVAHRPISPDELIRDAGGFDIGLALEPGHTPNSNLALSNKLFTYLLAGLPTIATATSAQADFAAALGGATALVSPGDVSGLAAAVRGWSEHPDRHRQAADAAWRLGASRYNWDYERVIWLETIQGVLERTVRRSPDRRAS